MAYSRYPFDMSMNTPPPKNEDSLAGFGFALVAYMIWGLQPIFMKMLAHIPTAEVIAHRIFWSFPIALLVILWTKRSQELRAAFRNPRTIMMAAACSVFLSVNWGAYVWAISNDQALAAALGYYINPLFSVLVGRLMLNERLNLAQWLAIALAGLAVGYLAFDMGEIPWLALVITLSWGVYAYMKKWLPIGANQGFMLEVTVLAPFALGYILWLGVDGTALFASNMHDTLLLLGVGVITAVPLMIYGNAAKRLRLSTIAMMQYITPTFVFLIAVFVFKEPFGSGQAVAFPLIWLALLIYTTASLRRRKEPK